MRALLFFLVGAAGCLDTASLGHLYHEHPGDGGPSADASIPSDGGAPGDSGAPGDQCVSGMRDCLSGDTPRLCVDGHWQPQAPCGGNTPKCSDGQCVDHCGGATVSCHPDADGDHYGAQHSATQTVCGTQCPPGSAPNDGDCDDTNASINPGRTEPLFAFPTNATTFDANCDGKVTVSYCAADDHAYCFPVNSTTVACSAQTVSTCDNGNGWQTSAPGCGQTASYVSCAPFSSSCMVGGSQNITAGCL